MNTYRPKYFTIQELVDPETYSALGDRAWLVLDVRMVITIDQLREKLGSAYINDWHLGNAGHNFRYRGFRPPGCTIGAPLSQHRFGRAADMTFLDYSAEAARKYILANRSEFPFLTTLESGVAWTHLDTRDQGSDDIILVNP